MAAGGYGLCESISIRGDDHHVATRRMNRAEAVVRRAAARPGNGPWIDRWPKSDSLYRRPHDL